LEEIEKKTVHNLNLNQRESLRFSEFSLKFRLSPNQI